jgi:RIO-like serine/threonine protein kinase
MEIMSMSSKKSNKKNLRKASIKSSRNGSKLVRVHSDENFGIMLSDEGDNMLEIDYTDFPQPIYLNPESAEEREKRLAKRKARTLRIFRTAYENHHGRKAS